MASFYFFHFQHAVYQSSYQHFILSLNSTFPLHSIIPSPHYPSCLDVVTMTTQGHSAGVVLRLNGLNWKYVRDHFGVCVQGRVCVCKDIKKCINACLTAGGLVLYKRVCIMQHWTVCQVMQWNEWPGKLPISLDPHSAHFSTSLTLLQFSVLLSVVS